MTYQEEENLHTEQILNGFGIHTRNENTGEYLSMNEVMISVSRTLKKIRESNDDKYYQIAKGSILFALLGKRYGYEIV